MNRPTAWISALLVTGTLAGALLWLGARTLELNPSSSWPSYEVASGRNRPQGDFYRGAFPEVVNCNPFTTSDATARRYVLDFTHDGLMDLDPDGQLRPALAEAVEPIGATELEVRLRSGVLWSDGTPLGMADLEWTLRASMASPLTAGRMGNVTEIAEFEALDDRRCRVRFAEPHFAARPMFATLLTVVQAKWFRAELARRATEAGLAAAPEPGDAEFAPMMMQIRKPGPGTGPYRIGSWVPEESLTLVPNLQSWRREAQPDSWNLAGIHMEFLGDRSAQLLRARELRIDWLGVGGNAESLMDEWPELREHFALHEYDNPQVGSFHIVWNHRREGLGDPAVRRALTMLFDREAIVRDLFQGAARVPASWFRPGSPEIPEDAEPLPFDPEAASALLAEAGYGPHNPLRLEMVCATAQPAFRHMLEMSQASCERAGVELQLVAVDPGEHAARLESHDFDGLLRLRYHGFWIDPFSFFMAADDPMGYESPAARQALSAARSELDPARRIALFHEFHEIFQREQPVTLLAYPLNRILLHRRFRDVNVGPKGMSPERWWVPPELQLVK